MLCSNCLLGHAHGVVCISLLPSLQARSLAGPPLPPLSTRERQLRLWKVLLSGRAPTVVNRPVVTAAISACVRRRPESRPAFTQLLQQLQAQGTTTAVTASAMAAPSDGSSVGSEGASLEGLPSWVRVPADVASVRANDAAGTAVSVSGSSGTVQEGRSTPPLAQQEGVASSAMGSESMVIADV